LNAIIRSAFPGDAPACATIYAPFVTDSWVSFETEAPSAAEMERRITDYSVSHAWLVAEWDNDIAGYAYASPHRSRSAYSTSVDVAVYVDPVFARKGVGRALYEALFQTLKKAGFHAAFAGIALPNDGSIGLHEAMGFTPVGIYREVGWKMGSWRDVGWWQRLL
jgi:L-amino acid N-acyltransferase YncA